jgi:hypothetical protein
MQLKGTFVSFLDLFRAPFAKPTFSEQLANRRERWEKGARPNFGPIYGKLGGRKFMEENGCNVPDLLGLYSSIEEVPEFSDLPSSFVLKLSRGDGAKNVFVMSNGINLLDGNQYTREAMVQAIKNSKEGRHYEGKYMVEELLVNWDGREGIPYDYKFWMFGESIAFIHVIERNSAVNTKSNRHWYLKEDWSNLGFKVVTFQQPQTAPLPKPDCHDELFHVVRKTGRKLNMFMRIDMYATTKGAVFGEFTPIPHGGKGYTKRADRWLGGFWRGVEGGAQLDGSQLLP